MTGRAILFMVMTAILLSGLFLLLRPVSDVPPPAKPLTVMPAQSPMPAVPELVVRNGTLVTGPQIIRVKRGDEVRIRITADVAEELHLHGYDLKLDLEPGVQAELRLVAEHAGRFEYELEKSHLELGVLEVLPP